MKMRVYAAWIVTKADDSHPDSCVLYDFFQHAEDAYSEIFDTLNFTFDTDTMISNEIENQYMFLEKAMTDVRGLV